jgi:hypothetical protein
VAWCGGGCNYLKNIRSWFESRHGVIFVVKQINDVNIRLPNIHYLRDSKQEIKAFAQKNI